MMVERFNNVFTIVARSFFVMVNGLFSWKECFLTTYLEAAVEENLLIPFKSEESDLNFRQK